MGIELHLSFVILKSCRSHINSVTIKKNSVFQQLVEAMAAAFPLDIIVDIFSKLPAKSLCRFKCLSQTPAGATSE